jgi:hypothetical protein
MTPENNGCFNVNKDNILVDPKMALTEIGNPDWYRQIFAISIGALIRSGQLLKGDRQKMESW